VTRGRRLSPSAAAAAADAHADRQLVVRAAWEAARLGPAAAGALVDPGRTRAFDAALLALRPTLAAAAYAALRARYDADRPGFGARLAARGG
jgi:hypothetical protein